MAAWLGVDKNVLFVGPADQVQIRPGRHISGFYPVAKGSYPAKIEPAKGLFIETWVRKPEEIQTALDELKQAVSTCNDAYIARIQAEARAAADVGDSSDEGEQGRLNRIIASLNFDD